MKSFEEVKSVDRFSVRINRLREWSIEDIEKSSFWTEALFQWDKDLKNEMQTKFGSTRFLQQVPAWQTLVGGTPESETDISDEVREFIEMKVEEFITAMEEKIDAFDTTA